MKNRGYAHPSLTEFAGLAEALCRTIRNDERHAARERVRTLHDLIARAYCLALRLPPTSVLLDDAPDSEDPSSNQRELADRTPATAGLEEIAEYLGERRFYREIFDPYSEPTEQEVMGDLIDDLGDIYVDLASGLARWGNGEAGEALWEWRFNFEAHWAEHATSALRALFALAAWRDEEWPAG